MATTNFSRLLDEQVKVWSRDLWANARNKSFIMNWAGTSSDSMVHRITELTKTSKGLQAIITLVADLEGDGVIGDNQLVGNEEELKAYDHSIQIDQMRNANRNQGRMGDQSTIVNFREQSRDKLAYWLANRIDELAFLTMSGVSYTKKTDGSTRVGSQFPGLAFAADVSAPSTNRHFRWVAASNTLAAGDTSSVVVGDKPSWKMIVAAKAKAVNQYLRPVRSASGIDVYNIFMTPDGIAALKNDTDFLAAWQQAQKRGEENPLFKGTPHGGTSGIYVDGMNILEYRHVYNTSGATSGVDKWGSGFNVEGQRVILAGAQALAFVDLGMPEWDEEKYDYNNSYGIATSKILGFRKPVLRSQVTGTNEDFGLMVIDTAV